MFGFLRKKKQRAPPKDDPVAAYDGVIEGLERHAGEVRKSAATLLSLRGQLKRDLDKYATRLGALQARLTVAGSDDVARRALTRDATEAKKLLEQTQQALENAEGDAKLLLETAEGLKAEVAELKEERLSARARFSAGIAVSEALRTRVEEFDRTLKLDAARDEVEKAHALAELYREESKAR